MPWKLKGGFWFRLALAILWIAVKHRAFSYFELLLSCAYFPVIFFCPRNSSKKALVLFMENSRIWFIYERLLVNFYSFLGFTEFQKFTKNEAVKEDFLRYSVLTFQWLSFARRTAAAATRKLSSRTRKVGKIGASLDSRLMYWIPILYFFPLSAFGCHN